MPSQENERRNLRQGPNQQLAFWRSPCVRRGDDSTFAPMHLIESRPFACRGRRRASASFHPPAPHKPKDKSAAVAGEVGRGGRGNSRGKDGKKERKKRGKKRGRKKNRSSRRCIQGKITHCLVTIISPGWHGGGGKICHFK